VIKSDTGEILELKEGVVINEDGSEAARSKTTTFLFGLKPGGVMAGVLAAFAIPLVLFFGLIFLGGFLSIAALILLFQPFARKSSGTDVDPHSIR
jgi:hypothetical protein